MQTTKRPSYSSREVIKRYWTNDKIDELMSELESAGLSSVVINEDEYHAIRKELVDAYDNDAYRYAKNLENNHYWEFDYNALNLLDISTYEEYRQLTKEWVQTQNLIQQYFVGQRVKIPRAHDNYDEGIIDRFMPDTFQYIIIVEGKKGKPIVNQEDIIEVINE